MFKLSLSAAFVTLAVTASSALADDKQALLNEFLPYTSAPGAYEDDKSQGDLFDVDVGPCFQLVDKMRAAGFEDSESFPLYPGGTWRFKQAKQLCEKFRSYQLKIHAANVVAPVSAWLEKGDGDFAMRGTKDIESCITVLDRLVSEGLPTDAELLVYDKKVIVHDAQKGCAALLVKGKAQVEQDGRARAEKQKAFVAKWGKLGVSGKRLDIIQAHGDFFYLPGCLLTDDPRKIAKAKVLRLVLANPGDVEIYVKSWHFKGNTLVKHTETTWDRRDKHRACK
jgi:hypothetical protein